MSGRTAIVGAPNLDTFESGTNSGGGYVYDLGFVSLQFAAKTFQVVEGSTLSVPVVRCNYNNGFCPLDVT